MGVFFVRLQCMMSVQGLFFVSLQCKRLQHVVQAGVERAQGAVLAVH